MEELMLDQLEDEIETFKESGELESIIDFPELWFLKEPDQTLLEELRLLRDAGHDQVAGAFRERVRDCFVGRPRIVLILRERLGDFLAVFDVCFDFSWILE